MTPMLRLPISIVILASLAAAGLPARTAGAQGFDGLYTPDGIDVIAVGDNGETYRSLDGGSGWSERVLGSPVRGLRDVAGRGLTLVVVGDDGFVWSSFDCGGHWASTVVPSGPALNAVAMPSDSVWIVAGGGGTIRRTTDNGASWNNVASGTSQTLNALRFTNALHGWAAGDGGTLLATSNGGASWSSVATGTTHSLLSVDQRDATVWVVGVDATARRSLDGGASFAAVDLQFDARADVRCVTMQSADTLWLAGGGGFIRYTTDGGATWTFQRHPMLAPITRVVALGAGVWAANSANRVVMSSANRGGTWLLPTGASVVHGWGSAPRYALTQGVTRGNGFAPNPVFKNTIYCGLGYNVLRSRDDGETWQEISEFPNLNNACNAFVVSPKDSNLWLAALSGGQASDRIYRTTNAGATWTRVLTNNFGEFGVPLEMDPDHPDTVMLGGERAANGSPPDELERSTNFGATWTPISTASFRSPCDLLIFPDTTGIVLLSDGVTSQALGRFYKSTDGGVTFTLKATAGSPEIPMMATSRLRPNVVFGTIWSGGGVVRSSDYGETWPTVDNVVEPWAIDIARDDPNVVIYAQYSSPFRTRLSLDGGDSFVDVAPPAGFDNNYAFYARDRATILASQSSGIWKLQSTYGYAPVIVPQALQLLAPNGGESWESGSIHEVTWATSGVAVARIEYRNDPGAAWQRIADVGGQAGAYSWTVPPDATAHAAIRVYDLWDGDPLDASDGEFTIANPALAVEPGAATEFALKQNRPNPFSHLTQIEYTLPREADVRLEVFDVRGHRVATLIDARQAAGTHAAAFGDVSAAGRPGPVPAGVYFCRLQAGTLTATRKMLLLE